MHIVLSKEDLHKVVFDALCNGLGQFIYCGIAIDADKIEPIYNKYKQKGDAYEDVLMRMLENGEKLYFVDLEGDGAYNGSFTLEQAKSRLEGLEKHLNVVQTMLDENGDAITAVDLLQLCLYSDIIFG